MKKAKKAAREEKQGRQRTNWALFLRLCKEGKTNHQIAEKLGWETNPKSEDRWKRVRAAKSLARTKGIRVDGKVVFLRDVKLKGAEKAKAEKTKNKAKA